MTERTVHRLTAAEYRSHAKPKKRAKYRNVAVTVDGIRFASKREAAYYGQLKQREKVGEVSAIALQRRFDLIVNGEKIGRYTADFAFWDHVADRFRVIDVKGVETREFKRARKLIKALYQIDVELAQ